MCYHACHQLDSLYVIMRTISWTAYMLSCVQSVEQFICYHAYNQLNSSYVIMRTISWRVYMLSCVQSFEQIIWYHPSIQTNNLYLMRTISWIVHILRTISWTFYMLSCVQSVEQMRAIRYTVHMFLPFNKQNNLDANIRVFNWTGHFFLSRKSVGQFIHCMLSFGQLITRLFY